MSDSLIGTKGLQPSPSEKRLGEEKEHPELAFAKELVDRAVKRHKFPGNSKVKRNRKTRLPLREGVLNLFIFSVCESKP